MNIKNSDSQTVMQNTRREFLLKGGILAAGFASMPGKFLFAGSLSKKQFIKKVNIDKTVVIETEDGTVGEFEGSPSQNMEFLKKHLPEIRELLIGKDPLDKKYDGEMIWETILPGRAKYFLHGRDPITGEVIANKIREEGRHSSTGRIFMAFSTVDNCLWDLRGKLLGQPVFKIMGNSVREEVPVYWRPGEADKGLGEACKRAKDAYDKGYIFQKWYWNKSAKDGKKGLKENIELVRRLREAIPEGHLMIDNHSIRYYDDVDYSVELCKAVAEYKPFWIEEPICPEHVDGYARIKEETGVPIAGGEHWYTRWQAKAFLDRNCVDFIQVDPVWCGGISEWLKICEMVKEYPGVQVVPHITRPWRVAPHCVASQKEELCPLLEFNFQGGKETLEKRMTLSENGIMSMKMPEKPGISV